MFFSVAALVLILSYSNPVRDGEITVNWRTMIDSGMITELKFIPEEENFIITSGHELQIRSCEDGSSIAKYPIGVYKFGITPDNNKLAMIYNV